MMYKALLWKIWRTQRRKFIRNIIIILPPILFAYLLVFFKSHSSSTISNEGETIYDKKTKDAILKTPILAEILYAPNTSDSVNRLIGNVKPVLRTFAFSGMENDSAMLSYFRKHPKNFTTQQFGVVFDEMNNENLSYTIRSTDSNIWHVTELFPAFMTPGPMESSSQYHNFVNGFLPLQIAINDAFSASIGVPSSDWTMQEFPYPEYHMDDTFIQVSKIFIPLLFYYAFFLLMCSLLTNLIEEKTSGVKELLKINGVKVWMIYSSWLIIYLTLCALSSFFAVIVLKVQTDNGAVFQWANPVILWVFLVFYCITSILFVFLLSLFFNDAKFALCGLILFWVVCYSLSMSSIFAVKSCFLLFLSTFIPIGSVNQGTRAIVAFEATQEGISLSNLFSIPHSGSNQLSLGVTLLGMMVSWIIYGTLIWYLDKVKPGKLGIASPWHFIFPDSVKCTRVKSDPETVRLNSSESSYPSAIMEKVNRDTPVGIGISNLVKKYGTLVAVDNLTIDVYQNQITALLGHNGAGKSTLMGIISGMFSPTSGSVMAEGDEIYINIDNFRRHIGLCMQENVLLPSMSVYEHVVFFGMAKGLTMREAQFECAKLLDRFNLTEKKDDLVVKLSGGMKRKLCLAIALVSDPKVLLLDEPTSGLDPESRREIWDILTGYRGNRTILLSTHFMEEADYLGDRIAIMSHGRLKCYGTAMFLKKHYGAGYRLTIANCPENVAAEIKSTVLTSISSAKLLESGSLSFRLPSNDVNKFPKLFHDVEKIIQQSGDNSIALGVTCTNVDDVFLKIQKDDGVKTSVDEVDMPVFRAELQPLSFGFLLWQQFFGLMIKKFHWTISNWISLVGWLVVFPVLMTYLSLSSSGNLGDYEDPSLFLDLSIYGQTLAFLKGNSSNGLYQYFNKAIASKGSDIYTVPANEPIVTALLNKSKEDETFYRTEMIVSGDLSGVPNVMHSTLAYHSAPIAVNLLANALINSGASNATRNIKTFNKPYNIDASQCSGGTLEELAFVWVFTFSVGMLSSIAYFILFPHMERVTDVRHLQLMTGLSPITYWLSTLLFDLILFSLELVIIVIIIVVFDGSGIFRTCGFIATLALVVMLFGCSGIASAYFVSFFFNKHNNSMTTNFFVSSAIGLFSLVAPVWKKTEWLVYLCYLVPWAPFMNAIKTIAITAVNIYIKDVCSVPLPFASTYDLSLIKNELIYLAADTLLYLVLIMLFEYKIMASIASFIMDKLYGPIQIDRSAEIDPDVLREKTKAQEAMRGEGDPFFISHGLGKKYSRNTTAVYDINFTVAKKECFGLLGVNGAGKSTTFNMLAGLIRPSKGDAKIGQNSLMNSRSKFLQNLGYCPQLRGLIEDLSARQLLSLFARLRGVQPSQIQDVTNRWIYALDLIEVCDRPCKVYSGGNKRKLSTAMSIIGQPAVMLLDEPTTGVDPVIRRKLWDILRKCQQNDQTIIITSHSMDECEAVCEKLTIMVKGLMQCLGPIQLLKNKYGKGHTLVVKIMFNCVPTFYDAIKKKIQDRFPCELKEEQTGILHYHITKTLPYSQLFDSMNEIKLEHPQIEDFSLGDTSLEQVFLSFARYEQH